MPTDTENDVDPTEDDISENQVSRLLRGDQKREPVYPEKVAAGEGEHQMKGLFANPNPIEVGEAEALLKRQTDAYLAANGQTPDQTIPQASRVKSGTNKYTDIALVSDTRVAGGRQVDQFVEALGVVDPDHDGRFRDPQKVDPATGVAWTNEEGGTVTLNPDGTSVAMSLDPLGYEAEVTPEPRTEENDNVILTRIDPDELPDGISAVTDDAAKSAKLSEEIPIGGFDYPVKIDTATGRPEGEDLYGEQVVIDSKGNEYAPDDVDGLEKIDKDREKRLNIDREDVVLRTNVAPDSEVGNQDPVEAELTDGARSEDNDDATAPAAANVIDPDSLPQPDDIPTTGAPGPDVQVAGPLFEHERHDGASWSMENKKDELVAEAERLGLDSSGTKEELLERIQGAS